MAEARIGTAGWSIALAQADAFPAEGAGLERYAARFDCSEINSTFHRPHRASTYERWAASVPEGFRFCAKLPKTITHERRLVDAEPLLAAFLAEVQPLADKLAVLLVQLPPSLAFDRGVAERFLLALTGATDLRIVCEPRHPSWFDAEAEALLVERQVARVAADPAKVPAAAVPGGWRGLSYFRLHGSPVPYRSSYAPEALQAYADMMKTDLQAGREVWCIFDNTASSAATGNALTLQERVAATATSR
jgi:uncharacterized protein YecE (DUF72 family)